MEAHLEFASIFTCERATIQEHGFGMNVRGMYFQTCSPRFPVRISELQVAGFIHVPTGWDDRPFQLEIVAFDSDQNEYGRYSCEMGGLGVIGPFTPMLPFVVPLENWIVLRPEVVRFEAYLDGELRAQLPFEILKVEE